MHVFFDRFCFDIISLLGDNLVKLIEPDLDYIIRKLYLSMTHNFSGFIKLLKISCIESPFNHGEILQYKSYISEKNRKMINKSSGQKE